MPGSRASLNTALCCSLLLLLPLAAHAQKIHVNVFDPKADFSQFKTYSWAPHGAVARPMLAANIVGAIEAQMKQKGLQLVAENPDLVIQIYGSVDQDVSFNSADPLYAYTGGIPPFDPSFSGPLLAGTWGATSVVIHKGELVVDLIQYSTKKLVWRGIAQDNLSSKPDKLLSQVNEAIVKLFKQYPAGKG